MDFDLNKWALFRTKKMSTEKEAEESAVQWQPVVINHGFYSPLMSGSIDGTDTTPHDKAVRRALKAEYRVSQEVKGDPEKTIFVTRLSHRTTQDVLQNAFAKYGEINSCHLIRDIVTGRSMGYAFIEFAHADDADYAYEECHEMFLDGSQLIVDYECERFLPGWVPRRLGGGLGGKKESGQLRFGGRDRPFRRPIILGRQGGGHGDERRRDSRDEDRRESRRRSPRRERREESGRYRGRDWGEESRRHRSPQRRDHRSRKDGRVRSRSRSR